MINIHDLPLFIELRDTPQPLFLFTGKHWFLGLRRLLRLLCLFRMDAITVLSLVWSTCNLLLLKLSLLLASDLVLLFLPYLHNDVEVLILDLLKIHFLVEDEHMKKRVKTFRISHHKREELRFLRLIFDCYFLRVHKLKQYEQQGSKYLKVALKIIFCAIHVKKNLRGDPETSSRIVFQAVNERGRMNSSHKEIINQRGRNVLNAWCILHLYILMI